LFNSDFFDTKKLLKELFLMIEIRKDPFISQTKLSIVLDITPAMISRYLSDLESRALLIIEKHSQKDYQYRLTKSGMEYLNRLIELYIKDISRLKNLLQDHINRFQKEYELKVAITNSFGTLTPYLAKELGFFNKNQMNINLVEYNNGEKLMEDFEKNRFDIALLGSVPAYLWKTYGAPINVIASVDSGGHAIIVRDNSNIHSISDLKGKTIIIPENTTVTNNIFRIFIKKHNEFKVDYDRDINIINVTVDKIEEEFFNREVDALIVWEPYISAMLSKGDNLRILYDFSKQDNSYISNVIAVNEHFYSVYSETVERFIDTLKLVVDYYKNNPEEVNQLISDKLNIPLSVVEKARIRTRFDIKELL